ncbi:MAG: SDR family oxidoreductase [Candidatus Eisenbacteria bacterium]|nr:SDR family oxidoreductase [Candidatus Eisenbacteria bacterium]
MKNERTGRGAALVTGAGRGIGRAIATRLAADGAATALAARTAAELEEARTEIERAGGRAATYILDVTDAGAVEATVARAESELGPIDLLVNNAGSLAALGPTWETDPEAWWTDLRTNLYGVYLCCRALIPRMIARGGGRIVNLAGGGTAGPFPFASAYGSTKAAVMRLTETLTAELKIASAPIQVFALSPGFVRTAMTAPFAETEEGRRWMGRLADRIDRGLDIPPEKAAAMVAAIASGRLDALRGRYMDAQDDSDRIEEMEAGAREIIEKDLRVLRIRDK